MTALSIPRRGILRRRGRAAEGSRPPRERGDSGRSFLVTLIAVLLLAAFLSPMLRSVAYSVKSLEQITQAHGPLYPADPVTFSLRRRRADRHECPDARRDHAPAGAARTAAPAEHVRGPGRTGRGADRVGGLVADPGTGLAVRAAFRELRRGLGPDRLSTPAVQHRVHRGRLDHRHADLVHARRLWLCAVSVPRPRAPLHPADRHDLPPGRRDDHPDLHGVPADRMGRDVAAAAGARVLRERVRRLPDAPVLHDDPDRDRRGRGDRRCRSVPDADLGGHPAGLAGHRRGRGVPPRLLLERLLRSAPVHGRQARDPDRRPGAAAIQRHLLPRTRATSRPAR